MGRRATRPTRLEAVFSAHGERRLLCDLPETVDLDALVPGEGGWEVELGFGKGRYLLRRAEEEPGRRFLGVELVSRYFRLLESRASRRGLENLLAIRGEALYLLATTLPRAFADAVHIYFPDPWPKSRHHKRRLFDPETVDLVLGLLRPGGELLFATDFLDYGEDVARLLEEMPGLEVVRRAEPWPEGPRTNYETKFIAEGRPILRLVGHLREEPTVHPRGRSGLLAAPRPAAAPDPKSDRG